MARPKVENPPVKHLIAAAARDIAVREGPEKLTVRAVATKADVSSNTPFRYYPGGAEELLATVALSGFADMHEFVHRAPVAELAVERSREVTARYVEFGVRNANLYRTMFHRSLAEPLELGASVEKGELTIRPLREAKQQAYDDIVAPLLRLQWMEMLHGRSDAREAPGLALAAMAHGLVGEFIDEGLLPPLPGTEPWTPRRQAMTTDVTEVLLLGLLNEQGRVALLDPLTHGRMAPAEDPSWAHYRDTILEFFPSADTLRVDLREPVSAKTAKTLGDRGLPDEFAVLTASNPRGRTVSAGENIERMQQLKQRLREEHQLWLPVDGVSPDRQHREEGVAVALSREAAIKLAREFEQSAIYWFEGREFGVVGALVESEVIRLPALTELRVGQH